MATENYKLVSCDPTAYPTILNVCWKGRHPYEGLVVYIIDGLVDTSKTYTLTYVGQGVEVCNMYLPSLEPSVQNSCTPSYKEYELENCNTGELVYYGFVNATPTSAIVKIGCECYRIIQESTATQLITTSYTNFDRCSACLGSLVACDSGERTKSYALKVNLPDAPPPDRGFSKCCYSNVVLADTSDADDYKNDYTGFWFKRELPNSTCTFKLKDIDSSTLYTLNSSTYGTFQDFGGVQPDLTYFIVEWRKVLSLLTGTRFQIIKELNIAGISIDVTSDTYILKPFSILSSDKTIRIDSIMDGMLIEKDTDFTNSGYKTSMRLRGFFGRAEYSYEQDNISKRDYSYMQNTMSSKREYKFQALQIPECISNELWNFILFGKELFISDYNGNNHSYKYEVLPVKLEGNTGTEFFVTDRGVNINLTFSDRTENNRKINC